MDFITQFEDTLEQTIRSGMYAQAKQLVDAYPATGHPYSLKLFSLINRLRHNENISQKRIVIFLTGNFILDYISKQFCTFFHRQNYDILLFDPDNYTNSTDALFSFARKGIDCAYFFNNVGLLQTLTDGRNLWETLEIPCVNFLVDHPMYYADSLDHAPARTTLLVADRTHVAYVRRFYPRVQEVRFLPTGGCEITSDTQDAKKTLSPLPWAERVMDILFIGSYKYHADYSEDTLDQRITEHLIRHTDHTFEQAVELCLSQAKLSDGTTLSESFLKETIEQHRFLETNLTARYRITLLEQLLSSGLHIHVYGNGWSQTHLTGYPNFHLHKPVSFEEGIALMADTKILLNHMAWFKNGSSERIFNAMAQGALCVTDSSRYLDDILKDGINCKLFSLSELLPGTDDCKKQPQNGIPNRISALLSCPETASQIALAGQKTAAQHTWQNHLLYAIIK